MYVECKKFTELLLNFVETRWNLMNDVQKRTRFLSNFQAHCIVSHKECFKKIMAIFPVGSIILTLIYYLK